MSLLNVVYCSVAITDRIFRRFENQSINIQTKLETVPLHNISIDVFLNLSVGKFNCYWLFFMCHNWSTRNPVTSIGFYIF